MRPRSFSARACMPYVNVRFHCTDSRSAQASFITLCATATPAQITTGNGPPKLVRHFVGSFARSLALPPFNLSDLLQMQNSSLHSTGAEMHLRASLPLHASTLHPQDQIRICLANAMYYTPASLLIHIDNLIEVT